MLLLSRMLLTIHSTSFANLSTGQIHPPPPSSPENPPRIYHQRSVRLHSLLCDHGLNLGARMTSTKNRLSELTPGMHSLALLPPLFFPLRRRMVECKRVLSPSMFQTQLRKPGLLRGERCFRLRYLRLGNTVISQRFPVDCGEVVV